MTWQTEIDEIQERKRLIAKGGIPERITRQHAQGKMTVRERIATLADSGSFHELSGLDGGETYDGDKLVAIMPSTRVMGWCTLDGRKVVVNGDDSTVRHDLPSEEQEPIHLRNAMGYGEILALGWRLPYIRLLDAPGASVRHYESTGRPEFVSLNQWVEAAGRVLQVVPTVSAVLGSIAGKPAIEANLCHFNVMVKGTGHVFPGGPPVVKAALGQDIHKEVLGGWEIATSTGMVDNVVENEAEAFDVIRRFLSYLPSSVWELPPRVEPKDDPCRRDDRLLSAVEKDENRLYDPYAVLEEVMDHGSLFEIAPLYGTSQITAFGRANGRAVGVIATNPNTRSKGAVDVDASEKVIRFLQLCDIFHLPIVSFVDERGFLAGPDSDRQGIARAGGRLVQAIRQTRMPLISFVIGAIDNVATSLALRSAGMCARFAWPSATAGGRKEEKPPRLSFHLAEVFGLHGFIDPRDTRPLLCDFVEGAQAVLATQMGPGAGPCYRL